MNLQRLRLFLLSLCVCLSVLCSSSHIAHATESNSDDLTFNIEDAVYVDPNTPMLLDTEYSYIDQINFSCFTLNGPDGENWSNYVTNQITKPDGNYTNAIWYNLNKAISSGSYDITITFHVGEGVSNFNMAYLEFYNSSGANLKTINASSTVKTSATSNTPTTYSVKFKNVTLQEDFVRLFIVFTTTSSNSSTIAKYMICPSVIEFKTVDNTSGLLGSIIEIVRNIWNGISNLPSNIANSIKGFFDNVVSSITNMMNVLTNALTSLGNFLIDGIKGLFVPSSEELQSYFDNWKQLLSDRFGALYEVFDIIISYFQSFSNTASTVGADSTITFPSVSIPLAGTNFVFGGWEVNLVPAGFTIIFDALKLMINVVCTIAFVNSLRRRYDRVVEK